MSPERELFWAMLKDEYTLETFNKVRAKLDAEHTLEMQALPSGVFSAAVTTDFSNATNYHAAWVRDNVHVAYAHFVNGKKETAAKTAMALSRFFGNQVHPKTKRNCFDRIIAKPTRKNRVMQRPQVRFHGDDLTVMRQRWSHAQNDALGYFLWLYCDLALQGAIPPDQWDIETLARFLKYFKAIEYWQDEDSGHWEEVRKISASSIGAVLAGLRKLRELHTRAQELSGESEPFLGFGTRRYLTFREQIPLEDIDNLTAKGNTALERILPMECMQQDVLKYRPFDAALLFLIYPLEVVAGDQAQFIVRLTEKYLRGSTGIKRYLGDSFYCTDYESKIARRQDDLTRDFSDDIAERDKLLGPDDSEAEWCIFDSILSVYYGRKFQDPTVGRDRVDLQQQTLYLNRALRQVTEDDPPRCRAFQCPELYYREVGRLQTSRATPLLWAQANLWTALHVMSESLAGEGPIANKTPR